MRSLNASRVQTPSPSYRSAAQRKYCWKSTAALSLGLAVVSLYMDDRPDNTAYMLSDSAAKLLLVQDATQWRRLQSVIEPLPDLNRILIGAGGRHRDQ